jgi:hypothetical protein
MRALDAAQLLGIWEQGLELSSPRRALALLEAALPEADANQLAALPVGRRDDLLLQLREHLFGSELTLLAACPACGAQLESTLQHADLCVADLPVADLRSDDLRIADFRIDVAPAQSARALRIDSDGIVFHAPTCADLIDLPSDLRQACLALLSRCVDSAPDAADIGTWSAANIEMITAAMAAADPQAHRDVGMVCAACNHHWESTFDIVSFLWCEIEAWAQRTLREVHMLARAYAWREQEILALSPTRRQLYLELSQP